MIEIGLIVWAIGSLVVYNLSDDIIRKIGEMVL